MYSLENLTKHPQRIPRAIYAVIIGSKRKDRYVHKRFLKGVSQVGGGIESIVTLKLILTYNILN